MLVGFEGQILPALLAGADVAMRSLPNTTPDLFVGVVRTFERSDLAKATELHQRILPLVAVYTLSDSGLGSAKLAMRKLGFLLSPTLRVSTLPAPLDSEEATETTLEAAGLLPVQGAA